MNGKEYVDKNFTKQQLLDRLYINDCPHDFGFKTKYSVDMSDCGNGCQGDCLKCWNSEILGN